MKKLRVPRLENTLYALGLFGFILLMLGIMTHMLCNGRDPCPLGALEKLAGYFGHACLVLSALCYCLMPFLKRHKRST